MATGHDFHASTAHVFEAGEQGPFLGSGEPVAAGVRDDGMTARCANPVHRVLQRGPGVFHIAWVPGCEKAAEDFVRVSTNTLFNQKAGEMGARNQRGIASMAAGSSVGVAHGGVLFEGLGHQAGACITSRAHPGKAAQQGGVRKINTEADDMHGLVTNGNRDFDAGHEAQAELVGRHGGFGQAPGLIMVGQRPDLYAISAGALGEGGWREGSVRHGGVAVQIDVERGRHLVILGRHSRAASRKVILMHHTFRHLGRIDRVLMPSNARHAQAHSIAIAPMQSIHRPTETPATAWLRRQKADFSMHTYDYVEHGGAAWGAEALGLDAHVVVKTLVMQNEAARPLVVLMHGDCQVSTKNLARAIGVKSVQPCAPEVAQRHSGYQVGGTSPFAMRKPMPVYVEESVLALERIYINGGRRGLLLGMSSVLLTVLLQAVAVQCALPRD